MHAMVNGISLEFAPGETYGDVVASMPGGAAGALGVLVNGRPLSLGAAAADGAQVRVLTYRDEEGRRIYERSLQLLFLAAAHQAAPGLEVRFEHSYGQGLYITISGAEATDILLDGIEARMTALAEENLPIERLRLPTEEAREIYATRGQPDRLRLLKYREYAYITLYRLMDELEYFYGEMVPSTGYIRVFRLHRVAPGIVLSVPDVADCSQPAQLKHFPKLLRTYQESAHWSKILGCSNAADLNAMTLSGELREFIRVNEALQERKVQAIADMFAASGARMILIAGPSSSGKTTFAHRLQIALRVLGLRPMKISLDDYYLNREDIPLEEDGSQDLERIDTLDLPLLQENLRRLLAGEKIDAPEFDFVAGRRKEKTHPMRADADQPLVIEGIHALNPKMTRGIPDSLKFRVYISALTMLNLDEHNRIRTTDARLLRRIVRDYQFRGTPPEDTMAMWNSVRRGEERYIFPFQEEADVMFNSSLDYELTIMKKYVYPVLCAVGPESPYYTLALRLVKILDYIRTADVEDEIPINSILREFIGGCCFYRMKD